ncbi:uncharacterized protein LOC128079010 [Tympanuchus pallidicinctus]|uniref:uncharacterized protein LOC128079010 n=1 Tax=Tympanuchus pallidicinctus TaxID=109042 RepID=UPI0022876952|nr:uncharacterized protein LOC128079010 [Tympanuchus pallidicinctus]
MKEDLEKAVPGVTGSEGHPASPPSSRTEALSDHTGPERGKGASRGGYYAWWSSRVQRKPVMKIGEAVHGGTKGTDQETVQKKPLQEGSSDTQPVSDRNAQAEQAAALPGVDVGKITKAAVGKELQKRHIPVVAVVSAALLSVLTLACIPMLWMWKKYLARKRERAAAGQAPPDTDCERDQNTSEGQAELEEAAEQDALDQGNNFSIPLWWSSNAEFAKLHSGISTDPSLQPAWPSSSPADNISSVHTCSP